MDLYVIQHTEIQIDGYRIFTSLDTALDRLKEWYELSDDDDLSAYAISVFSLDESKSEYIFKKQVDLEEYFSESEVNDEDDADTDTDDDEDIDSSDEEN